MLLDAAEYLTVARREESIVADSDKPVREYVLGEQIQEGVNLHGHDAMLSAFPVHLVIVGDLRAGHVQNPGIGDSHTIGIATNVFKYLVDSLGRRTRIDDPIFCKALLSYSLINDDTILLEPPGK